MRFGTLSIRTLLRYALSKNQTFVNELIWRDFYQQILWHFPHVVKGAFRKEYDGIQWENNEEHFAAWCSKLKVLHITPWYPSPSMPGSGIFIQRQIAGLAAHMDQFVLHIDLSFDGPVNESESGQHFKRISRKLNLKLWRWYELRFYRMLRDALIKMDASNEYTHVVFHIAYPALIFLEKLRPHLPEKILISEHWSAYGLHFSSKKRLNRVRDV